MAAKTSDTGSTGKVDGENVFKVSNVDMEYWNTYLAMRPTYSSEFYEQIFVYYKEHSPGPSGDGATVAHDIGTGPGNVIPYLAEQFDHVIASDLNPTHLDIARMRNSDLLPPHSPTARFTLVHSAAESIASQPGIHPQSASMITVAECLPLLDAKLACAAWATLLKPKGTLAIWFYGRPAVTEEPFRSKCQPIFDKLANRAFKRSVNESNRSVFIHSGVVMKSWLAHFALPETEWEDVRRVKYNPDFTMCFYDDEAVGTEVEVLDKSGPGDKKQEVVDRDFWAKQWEAEDFRRFLSVNLPAFHEQEANKTKEEQEIDKMLWAELQEAIGGPGKKVKISWPVSLVLATRK